MAPYSEDERFPATQWSLVVRAGVSDPQVKREALGQLLPRYLPALKAHLVYRKRFAPEQADDLLQEFITSKVLEKDLMARADRRLGKLRTFLLTALDRFVKNQVRNQLAQKRHPGQGGFVALDEHADGGPATKGPSEAFDVAWARGVIEQALRRMQAECESSGRMDLWGIFHCRVAGPVLHGTPAIEYAELIERFGLQSPSQAFNALATAKRMYARCLRAAIAEYAVNEQEVESELGELREIVARAAP